MGPESLGDVDAVVVPEALPTVTTCDQAAIGALFSDHADRGATRLPATVERCSASATGFRY